MQVIVDAFGNKRSYNEKGKLHSFDDQPAVVWLDDGTEMWFKDGLRHRDNDIPAVVCASGRKEWYKNDLLHRENDKPAVVWGNCELFYINGIEYQYEHKQLINLTDQVVFG